jgi:hypothetical protein
MCDCFHLSRTPRRAPPRFKPLLDCSLRLPGLGEVPCQDFRLVLSKFGELTFERVGDAGVQRVPLL